MSVSVQCKGIWVILGWLQSSLGAQRIVYRRFWVIVGCQSAFAGWEELATVSSEIFLGSLAGAFYFRSDFIFYFTYFPLFVSCDMKLFWPMGKLACLEEIYSHLNHHWGAHTVQSNSSGKDRSEMK